MASPPPVPPLSSPHAEAVEDEEHLQELSTADHEQQQQQQNDNDHSKSTLRPAATVRVTAATAAVEAAATAATAANGPGATNAVAAANVTGVVGRSGSSDREIGSLWNMVWWLHGQHLRELGGKTGSPTPNSTKARAGSCEGKTVTYPRRLCSIQGRISFDWMFR